jgi:hypothetical protein
MAETPEESTGVMSDWVDEIADGLEEPVRVMEPRALYDQAIVGMIEDKVVYDRGRVIDLLEEDSEMSREDAIEYHYFNQDCISYWLFLDRP